LFNVGFEKYIEKKVNMKIIVTILAVIVGVALAGPIGGIIGFFVGAWGYNLIFIKGQISQAPVNEVNRKIEFMNDVIQYSLNKGRYGHETIFAMFNDTRYAPTLLSCEALGCAHTDKYKMAHVVAAYDYIEALIMEETLSFMKE
jgi:hypothetical protein